MDSYGNFIKTRTDDGKLKFGKCVTEIIDFTHANYLGDISLESISASVRYNKYYVCRIFKEETGISLQEYITGLRIEHAKTLLSSTDLSLQDVVFNCGYSSQSYFCFVFKKRVGVTPFQYLKTKRKQDNKNATNKDGRHK